MGMNKIPTLILGIGGIGCRIAAGISDLLSPEDRQHIGIVGMDTNVNDLSKLDSHGIRTIKTSDERTVGDYLKMHPEYTSWFPVNRFTVSRGMLNGAGQIRAISRLAALASEESGAFIPIKEEIKRIRTNRGEGNNGNLTVMVVGSITGGMTSTPALGTLIGVAGTDDVASAYASTYPIALVLVVFAAQLINTLI